MRRDLLKRLEALEQAANTRTFPRLTFVNVLQLPDDDREAYWSGDVDVLNRYAPPVPDLPPGTIHTIIVTLNPESRSIWEQARGMSDEEYDAWDEQRIRESERKAPEPVPEAKSEARYDWNGYPIID
jgi:hypothetical protein